jgi:hypothetical protein
MRPSIKGKNRGYGPGAAAFPAPRRKRATGALLALGLAAGLAGCGAFAEIRGYAELTPVLEVWDPATGRRTDAAVFADRKLRPAAAYFEIVDLVRRFGFGPPGARIGLADWEPDPGRRDDAGRQSYRSAGSNSYVLTLERTGLGFSLEAVPRAVAADGRADADAAGRAAVRWLATLWTAGGKRRLETAAADDRLVERVFGADGTETAVYERPLPAGRVFSDAVALVDPPGYVLSFTLFDPSSGRSDLEYRFWRLADDATPGELRPPLPAGGNDFSSIVRLYADGSFVRDDGASLRLHAADGAALAAVGYGGWSETIRLPLDDGGWLIIETMHAPGSAAGSTAWSWEKMHEARVRLVAADLSAVGAVEVRGEGLLSAVPADGVLYLLVVRGEERRFSYHYEPQLFF